MTRCGCFAVLGTAVVLLSGPLAPASAQGRDIEDEVAVQGAIRLADALLLESKPGEAVKVLEQHLSRIDGNARFLARLREAYKDHITNLHFQKNHEEADRFIRRLRILDPQLADQLARGVNADVTTAGSLAKQVGAQPGPAAPTQKPVVTELSLPAPPEARALPLAAAVEGKPAVYEQQAAPAALAPKFRAKMGDEEPDPFALANALPETAGEGGARELLARAEETFRQKRYSEARLLYRQAYQADRVAVEGAKDRYAYCMLNHAVEELNRGAAPLAELEREIQAAIGLSASPALADTGNRLLGQIAQRKGETAAAVVPAVEVTHAARDAQGWEVAETTNFRVFHRQPREYAEKVARIAEATRAEMNHKWFGPTAGGWRTKCDIYLHANAQDYSRRTGVPAYSPGHSRIETDSTSGEVVSRQVDLRCDNPDLLVAVLPHETTHVVLAGQFGQRQVPRWVDEGVAVLTEPAHKVDLHKRNLGRFAAGQELFHVRELMEMDDYPDARRIGAFYAQSVSLVEFLTGQRGPLVFTQFVRDGLREGYPQALQRHYGFQDFGDLQTRWSRTALAAEGGATAGLAQR